MTISALDIHFFHICVLSLPSITRLSFVFDNYYSAITFYSLFISLTVFFLQGTTFDSLDDLPPNWEYRSDPASGKIYFVNVVTKASQWDRPTLEDSDFPLNWEKRTDPASGKPYYVNVVTKESRWTKPVCSSFILFSLTSSLFLCLPPNYFLSYL